MPTCPYCNAEIEQNAAACPSCGRHFTVEITGPRQEQRREEQDNTRHTGRTIYYSRGGCGCCGIRFLALACIVGGLWYRQLWVMAALLLLLEVVDRMRRR